MCCSLILKRNLTLEWDYLTASLKAFNFGPEFIKWVKTFYKKVSSCILNNGFFSESFLLERGVRQGDPLSPYLFVTAVEILAIAIRSDSNIRGVKVGDEETKILAYADDMTATLSNIPSVERLPYSPLFSRDLNFAIIFLAHFASL